MPIIQYKVREYLNAWRRILTLARRPDDEEYSLLLKLNVLGFTVIGGIGYLIHLGYVILSSG